LTNGDTSELDQIGLGIGVDYNWSDTIMVGSAYNFSFINNKDENYDRHTLEIYASGRF
jgi:opacity protein-like surface antigen